MANYVVLASFTDQGIKGVKDTGKRAKGFRDAAKAMGCSMKDIYCTTRFMREYFSGRT